MLGNARLSVDVEVSHGRKISACECMVISVISINGPGVRLFRQNFDRRGTQSSGAP